MWMSLHDLQKTLKLMTKYLLKDMVTCLNMLTYKNGTSGNLIPAAIILGFPNTNYNEVNIKFGAYAQVYIGTTNITNHRTVREITTRLENERGGYYFISLATRKHIHSFICAELPINCKLI